MITKIKKTISISLLFMTFLNNLQCAAKDCNSDNEAISNEISSKMPNIIKINDNEKEKIKKERNKKIAKNVFKLSLSTLAVALLIRKICSIEPYGLPISKKITDGHGLFHKSFKKAMIPWDDNDKVTKEHFRLFSYKKDISWTLKDEEKHLKEALFETLSDAQFKKLDKNEQAAVKSYTLTSIDFQGILAGTLPFYNKKNIDLLINAFYSACETKEKMILYRGENPNDVNGCTKNGKYERMRFLSTSIDSSIANNFAGQNSSGEKVKSTVYCPPGVKVVCISGKKSAFEFEKEILFPPGTVFKLVKIEHGTYFFEVIAQPKGYFEQ
ncbi:MAG: hypothetical protein LBF97_02170 [Elusimicrobiota bacterium]|jgi:hypothetical protein|nr:hypothetical protein [Elusimicrobiota bacterium]